MYDPNFVQYWAIVIGGPLEKYGLTKGMILQTGVTELIVTPIKSFGPSHVGIHFRGTRAQMQEVSNLVKDPLTLSQANAI